MCVCFFFFILNCCCSLFEICVALHKSAIADYLILILLLYIIIAIVIVIIVIMSANLWEKAVSKTRQAWKWNETEEKWLE